MTSAIAGIVQFYFSKRIRRPASWTSHPLLRLRGEVLTPIVGIAGQHLATFKEFPIRQLGMSADVGRPSKGSSRRF